MQPVLKNNSKMPPKIIGLNPIFHINPKIKGQTSGLEASHKPALPKENMYFPMPM